MIISLWQNATWNHVTSHYTIWCHLTYNITWHHMSSNNITLHHRISHDMKSLDMKSHDKTKKDMTSQDIISHHITSYKGNQITSQDVHLFSSTNLYTGVCKKCTCLYPLIVWGKSGQRMYLFSSTYWFDGSGNTMCTCSYLQFYMTGGRTQSLIVFVDLFVWQEWEYRVYLFFIH